MFLSFALCTFSLSISYYNGHNTQVVKSMDLTPVKFDTVENDNSESAFPVNDDLFQFIEISHSIISLDNAIPICSVINSQGVVTQTNEFTVTIDLHNSITNADGSVTSIDVPMLSYNFYLDNVTEVSTGVYVYDFNQYMSIEYGFGSGSGGFNFIPFCDHMYFGNVDQYDTFRSIEFDDDVAEFSVVNTQFLYTRTIEYNLGHVYFTNSNTSDSQYIQEYFTCKDFSFDHIGFAYIEGYTSINEGDVTDAFNDGKQEGYTNGYSTGHSEGYNEGKTIGYSEGYTAGMNGGHITEIFANIFQVGMLPVNIFLKILNFNIYGVNVAEMVSALLTIAIVIIILRTIFGGKSDTGGGS